MLPSGKAVQHFSCLFRTPVGAGSLCPDMVCGIFHVMEKCASGSFGTTFIWHKFYGIILRVTYVRGQGMEYLMPGYVDIKSGNK